MSDDKQRLREEIAQEKFDKSFDELDSSCVCVCPESAPADTPQLAPVAVSGAGVCRACDCCAMRGVHW
jgi:hypothetical protein